MGTSEKRTFQQANDLCQSLNAKLLVLTENCTSDHFHYYLRNNPIWPWSGGSYAWFNAKRLTNSEIVSNENQTINLLKLKEYGSAQYHSAHNTNGDCALFRPIFNKPNYFEIGFVSCDETRRFFCMKDAEETQGDYIQIGNIE